MYGGAMDNDLEGQIKESNSSWIPSIQLRKNTFTEVLNSSHPPAMA